MNRRTFVAAAGVGLTAATAGCLSSADPSGGSGPSDDGDGDTDEEPADPTYTVSLEDDPLEDAGEFATLAVELVDPHVEPDSPAVLEATLTNTGDGPLEVSSGAPWPFGVVWANRADANDADRAGVITLWTDAYEESGHVGTDGKRVEGVNDIGLLEELEGGESITETFEVHEETPNLEAGPYETTIGCSVRPIDDAEAHERLEADLVLAVVDGTSDPDDGDGDEDVVPEDPRVDEPPYEIEVPEQPERGEEDEWNDHYLGEHMPAEPSLEFEAIPGVRLEEPSLSPVDADGDGYAVHLVETETERDTVLDGEGVDGEVRDRLEAIDFDRHLLVVVESGFGSSSVVHRWKRVEAVDDGVHLHGYDTSPYVRTSDYASRWSVLLVERPDDGGLELARASLTVGAETRVHVNSTEGAVSTNGTDE